MRTRAHDADEAFDIAYLSTFLGVDENDLHALTTAPTVELVSTCLRALTQKAADYEALKTDKLKVDVEYNDAVLAAEKKATIQKSTITRQSKEIDTLRKDLTEAHAATEGLTSQLTASKGAATESSGELETLRARVESLEASKRDALALLDGKAAEKDRLHEDLNEQHGKLVALRREFNELEQRNQALDNLTSTQKFKESSLRQEIDLLQKSNEWQQGELRTTSQEHAKFRKERNLTIGNLQRELEDANATTEALRSTEASLRQRLTELQSKLEEAYAKNASAQEDFVRSEQSLREQIESSKRLATLQAQSADMHKNQVQSLQTQIDTLKDQAAQEIGKLYADIDAERSEKTQAERRLAELEVQIERLEQQPRPSEPSTPVPNGSPRIADLSKSTRGMTHTQLYAQYVDAKQRLEREERRTSKLQSALDDLIQDMESKAPELVEMRQEQDRLEAEVLGFSRMLDEANEVRDTAAREATKWQQEAAAGVREGELLRQQLRDVSAQVKMLLVELQSKEQGLGEMSAVERLQLERAARGEDDQLALENVSSTQTLISERLVIFRSVSDLQSKNEQLLRLTRELGEKMEGEEAQEQARQSAAHVSQANELRAQVERYKDELQATATQIDSYMKERDMFRRMLQHRGTLPADADVQALFGKSVVPATPQRNGEPDTPRAKELDELNKLLKEQQSFFDQFRQESSNDRSLLKSQIDGLIRERSSLQADVGRLNSQVALAAQRYELLQSNYGSLRSENTVLQQRSQTLVETAAKQDVRTQQLVEELVEARSLSDTLRNESATAKAEKDLWKRIEARLTEDNQSLVQERGRLSKLVTDLQNLANERELNEGEARRRLQTRTEQLETELSDTKRKLDAELDNSRKVSMRKEYEENQSRTRIDDLVKSLGSAREDLVAAQTTRDQLQARVEEMRIDLRTAEDKLVALRPRPATTATNGDHSAGVDGSAQNTNGATSEWSTEQRLTIEIADLRRELDLANNELAGAREQIDQYKSIAQSTEEELQNFNETSGQYREEADRLLAERDASIEHLQQRMEELSAELATTNSELSDLRTRHDEASKILDTQRLTLEAELTRLRDDSERHVNEKSLYQQDLKAQAEIAQQAQQSYESELLKHADAARLLQTARQERDALREEVTGARNEAAAAASKLSSEEDSWSEQKDRLEGEIRELQRRKADGDNQNKLLHQQMETFSTELQALRQGRAAGSEGGDAAASGGDPTGKLQEVITFLRREKEIIEVQYELTSQEGKRLQQQLDHANAQLDDVHYKLAEERKQNTERSLNEVSTTKLAQAIDELNLFRESSVTLRNEARQAREKLEAKDRELDTLRAELQPLRARLDEVEANLEAKDSEVKLITDDRDHWRDRTQSIISKYDRIDPAELEELKARAQELEQQRAAAIAEQETLQATLSSLQQQLEQQEETHKKVANERVDKMREQAKEQNRKQVARIAEAKAESDAAQVELARVQAELHAATEKLAQNEAQPESQTDNQDLQQQIATATSQAAEQTNRADLLQVRVNELETQIADLTAQIETLQADRPDGQEQGEITEDGEAGTGELAAVQEKLAAAQSEIAQLRSQATATPVVATTQPTETTPGSIDDQINKLRAEMEQQHKLALAQVEEAAQAKIATSRAGLVRQLKEERAKMGETVRAELIEAHSTELQKLREHYENDVKQLKEAHAQELERLRNDAAALASRDNSTVTGSTTSDGADASGVEPQLTDEQVNALMKNNIRVRSIMQNSVRKHVGKETERLSQALADKNEEIAKLKESAAPGTTTTESSDVKPDEEKQSLLQRLENADKEKDAAVKQAVSTLEMKTRAQLSQRDIAQAKLAVVQKAAQDTPQKAVVEVWEEAKKARPAPKSAPTATPSTPTAANAASTSAAPATATSTEAPADGTQAAKPATSGIPQPSANWAPKGSELPRGPQGISVQGAASRGGRGGRGGGAGTGIKRQHDGAAGNNNNKRARGGGNQ